MSNSKEFFAKAAEELKRAAKEEVARKREQLLQHFLKTAAAQGVDGTTATLVFEIGWHAHREALETVITVCKRAPDSENFLSCTHLALQLLVAEAEQAMHGLETAAAALQGAANGGSRAH